MTNLLADYSRRFFAYLLHTPPDHPATPDGAPRTAVETLEDQVSTVLHKLQDEVQEAAAQRGLYHCDTLAEQEAARLIDRNTARDQMQGDICALHAALHTGLLPVDVQALQEGLNVHMPPPASPQASLDLTIDRLVCKSLLQHAGDVAWDRLVELMRAAGVAWPPYPELTHLRPPEEALRFFEEHHQEVKASLRAASVQELQSAMVGEVPAWSDFYPTRDGRVWIETCMTGIAAALQAQMYCATLTLWLGHPPKLQATITAELQHLLSVLGEPRQEDAADRLCAAIMDVASVRIPDLVWNYAQPRLVWVATAEQPRTVNELARDLTRQPEPALKHLRGG